MNCTPNHLETGRRPVSVSMLRRTITRSGSYFTLTAIVNNYLNRHKLLINEGDINLQSSFFKGNVRNEMNSNNNNGSFD